MVPRVQPIIENEPRMAPNWKRNEMKNEDKIVGKYLTATGKTASQLRATLSETGFRFHTLENGVQGQQQIWMI